jgi:hypothetical protein
MTVPPIGPNNNGIPGTLAWLKGLAPTSVDPAVDRLKGTLDTLRLGHNSTLARLAAAEKRITDLEATMPPFPTATNGRGLFVAWGIWNGQFTAAQLAARMVEDGYGWAVLEWDFEPEDDPGNYVNQPLWPGFRDALTAKGLLPGVWFTGNLSVSTPAGAACVVVECEGPGDYQNILNSPVPSVPRAIVTNFNVPLTTPAGVPDPEMAEPLIAKGYRCLAEHYSSDANYYPAALDALARQLGWPGAQMVYSLYAGQVRDPDVAYYETTFPLWQTGASFYLAEHLTW